MGQTTTEQTIQDTLSHGGHSKNFDSLSQQVNWGGQNKPSEDEIAEAIFDWWISGKPYKQWYADTYMQSKLEFEE